MKLDKLNLQGKGELLNEFELKNIKGGYYLSANCYIKEGSGSDGTLQCSSDFCDQGNHPCGKENISGTFHCVCNPHLT